MAKLAVPMGIIYYSHLRPREEILAGVRKQILKTGLPIVSCTLKPLDFGKNIVLEMEPGAIAYFTQIFTALKAHAAKYVFFFEHDVLYHPTHFHFIPPRDDTFYYNVNVWRWDYLSDRCITYDHHASVSGICVNRELAIDFYDKRLKLIDELSYGKEFSWGNPKWAREMGYEPGKVSRFSKEKAKKEEWRSPYPNIDIRHTRTMTAPKMYRQDFKHKPTGWWETTINKIPGWNKPRELLKA